jgi:hypothetical protein
MPTRVDVRPAAVLVALIVPKKCPREKADEIQ